MRFDRPCVRQWVAKRLAARDVDAAERFVEREHAAILVSEPIVAALACAFRDRRHQEAYGRE
jgi:hypothetical protein